MSFKQSARQPGPKPRACGCKGIRSCKLCEGVYDVESKHFLLPEGEKTFTYCVKCKKFVLTNQDFISLKAASELEAPEYCTQGRQHSHISHIDILHAERPPENGTNIGYTDRNQLQDFGVINTSVASSVQEVDQYKAAETGCMHLHAVDGLSTFRGVEVLEDFITLEEETYLSSSVMKTQFVNSQSGRRKQDFGPKVNFKKKKLKTANFNGLPTYSQFIYERMKSQPSLNDFQPVELCNLEYCQNRGAHIDPHLDDDWLWGERLVTLNLLSDSVLTFTLDSEPDLIIRVPLPRLSLIIVSSDARYKWKHSIIPQDIGERRIAMTFRELSNEFRTGGEREQEGTDLLKLALSFEGCAVNS